MTYVGQLPSTKPLRTLISFFRLRFTELCSEFQKPIFLIFDLSESFQKVKLLFLPFFNVCPCRYSGEWADVKEW